MEELLAKHRKEQRELQSRITQKKKNATKKTRKGVIDECDRLERVLAEQQQVEIADLAPQDSDNLEAAVAGLALDEPAEELIVEAELESTEGQINLNGSEASSPQASDQPRQRKPNRQKARLARRAAEQEAQAAAAAQEAENLPDLREQEMTAMKQHMESRGLSETLIRPDGHCLFSACAYSMSPDQLSNSEPNRAPYQSVRNAAGDFMASHPDDFAGFMEEPLESYVRKIRETAEWGGQLELQAIARSYHIDINVLQADGRVETISAGPDKAGETSTIWLAYYRHSFGLGEHYNALKKLVKS